MAKLEKESESNFAIEANKLDFYCLKLVLLGRRGWPDRTLIGQDTIFFIEMKRKGNKLSGPQRHWRRILVAFGFDYHVCYSEIEAIKVLKEKIHNTQLYREGKND